MEKNKPDKIKNILDRVKDFVIEAEPKDLVMRKNCYDIVESLIAKVEVFANSGQYNAEINKIKADLNRNRKLFPGN